MDQLKTPTKDSSTHATATMAGSRKRVLNVLLMGESGVGKSTWINAFANYCMYESLEKAVHAGGTFPIQSAFTVIHPVTKENIRILTEGKAKTTEHVPISGESVTQRPDEYIIDIKDAVINLIDTPGLKDTKNKKGNHDVDKKHVDNIIRLLSAYDEISAIFIVLKANEARLSEAFQYTLSAIFERLDTQVCNNVIFILTCASSSDYRADTTLPVLQRFLEGKSFPIPLPPKTENVYCFENRTVQYLVECKNGISHDKMQKTSAKKNWKISVNTTKAMLKYVWSLEPHPVLGMLSLNDATRMIPTLSKLMLDILMLMFDDVKNLEDNKKEAEKLKEKITKEPEKLTEQDIKKARQMLVITETETKLVTTRLDYTNVVCESTHCRKVEAGHAVYSQVCCSRCPNQTVFTCSKITWGLNCKVCGCGYGDHHRKNTDTKVVSERVSRPDEQAIANMLDKKNEELKKCVDEKNKAQSALMDINEAISIGEARIKSYKAEAQQMIEACAKLNVFMQQNALTDSPAEDDFLKCLNNAQQTFANSDMTTELRNSRENDLKNIEAEYQQHSKTARLARLTEQDIPKIIQQLYMLPMKGKEIKDLVDEEEQARRTVVETSRKHQKRIVCTGGIKSVSSLLQ